MGAPEFTTTTTTRLKREDCKRTKHDSEFSVWKILIGHSDWENYKLGKEGIERYRTHNLPLECSCPGCYELGIVVSQSNLGRDVRKLDREDIIVVYLGQADNVRTRLQEYGRAGSHLGHGSSLGQFDANQGCFSQKGPGLFKDIFSRGSSIAFRWAPMENKKEAEKTEAQLLSVFDYAWNKGGNGTRRPNDILLKLDKITSTTRKLQQWLWDKLFIQKQSGISIKASSPPSTDTQSDTCNDRESGYPRARIFKFGRTQPRLVSDKCATNEEPDITCGVALGYGSVCKRRPVEGRKRCGEHKGKRINGFITRPVTEKSAVCSLVLEDGSVCSKIALHGMKRCEIHEKWTVLNHPPVVISDTKPLIEDHASMCGIMLVDGSVCKSKPVKGRKRCGEHKGQRVQGFILRSATEKKLQVCGVGLEDGSVCTKVPVHGRKRCELHKGRRIITVNYKT